MSALPAFLTELVDRLTAWPALADTQVVDGPPLDWARAKLLAVGISMQDLTVESSTADAGLGSRREQADVTCLARSASGDSALAPRRAEAFAIVAEVEAALASDRKMGGTVNRARLVDSIYTPARTSQGTAAEVEFRIRVDAYRT